MIIVYYSGVSENTHRFVQKLNNSSVRIPIKSDETIEVPEPFILITPTYLTSNRTIPPQVVKFLNKESNRVKMVGVIGTGNTNFNKDYAIAAKNIAKKCEVPLLYTLELIGTPEDVVEVNSILQKYENKEKRKVNE